MYKAVKQFEAHGVNYKIGDNVPSRLVEQGIINISLVESTNGEKKLELLVETPMPVSVEVLEEILEPSESIEKVEEIKQPVFPKNKVKKGK